MNEIENMIKTGSRVGTTWGIIVIILGMFCIAVPWITGLGVTMMLGVALIATGIAQFFYVFKSNSFGSGAMRFIFSLFATLAGIALLLLPGIGLVTITISLAVWFIVDGIWALISGFRWRPFDGWGWMVFSGIASIILGGMVFYEFPVSALWLVGMMVGIRLLLAGWTMIVMGAAGEGIVELTSDMTKQP